MTDKQQQVMAALGKWEDPPSTRELADSMETPAFRSERFGYQEVRSHLRALERQGRVRRREGRPVRWERVA